MTLVWSIGHAHTRIHAPQER